MNKYDTLLNILDNICNTAPDNFKSYCLQEKSEDEKNQIRSKAFIHLYLLVKFGLEDFKSRHDLITDGIADGGLDAYFIDAETKYIYLFQSKFRTNSQNFENKDISVDELIGLLKEKLNQRMETHIIEKYKDFRKNYLIFVISQDINLKLLFWQI